MGWQETHERCCKAAAAGSTAALERWVGRAIMLAVALMWLGVLKAILRGAKLYSQELSSDMSAVLIPLATVAVVVAIGAGVTLGVVSRVGARQT